MNKLILIAFLAVCLAFAHGAVKREAPAEATTENLLKKFQDGLTGLGEQLQKTFNSEDFAKGFNDVASKVSEGFKDLKEKMIPTEAAKTS